MNLLKDQLSINWERMSGVSSLSAPPPSLSRVLVACVVASAVVVVTIGVVGRIGSLSLLLTRSHAMESHFPPEQRKQF